MNTAVVLCLLLYSFADASFPYSWARSQSEPFSLRRLFNIGNPPVRTYGRNPAVFDVVKTSPNGMEKSRVYVSTNTNANPALIAREAMRLLSGFRAFPGYPGDSRQMAPSVMSPYDFFDMNFDQLGTGPVRSFHHPGMMGQAQRGMSMRDRRRQEDQPREFRRKDYLNTHGGYI